MKKKKQRLMKDEVMVEEGKGALNICRWGCKLVQAL
jgi:hypothetical protein